MVGQELIQKLGTEMGLDQKVIDMAQAAFCKECGDMQGYQRNHLEAGTIGMGNGLTKFEQMSSKAFLQHILNGFDASPAQRGNAERAFGDMTDAIKQLFDKIVEDRSESEIKKLTKGGKGGWIQELARALGQMANKSYENLLEKRDDAIAAQELSNKSDGKKSKPSEMIEFQGASQEFQALMSTISTVLKAVGESAGNMARKQ